MDERIMERLDEVLASQIEELKILSISDLNEDMQAVIESLVKLYKLRQEDAKLKLDVKKAEAEVIAEEEAKEARLKEQKKDRAVKIALEGFAIVAPLIFYGIWMRRGFKFEETGAFTSTTFKGLFNRFRPTKN